MGIKRMDYLVKRMMVPEEEEPFLKIKSASMHNVVLIRCCSVHMQVFDK